MRKELSFILPYIVQYKTPMNNGVTKQFAAVRNVLLGAGADPAKIETGVQGRGHKWVWQEKQKRGEDEVMEIYKCL